MATPIGVSEAGWPCNGYPASPYSYASICLLTRDAIGPGAGPFAHVTGSLVSSHLFAEHRELPRAVTGCSIQRAARQAGSPNVC